MNGRKMMKKILYNQHTHLLEENQYVYGLQDVPSPELFREVFPYFFDKGGKEKSTDSMAGETQKHDSASISKRKNSIWTVAIYSKFFACKVYPR